MKNEATMLILKNWTELLLTVLITCLACVGAPAAEDAPTWIADDMLAVELSQLSPREFAKFTDSELLDVHPVVIPVPQNIVGANDYYMCPWTTEVDGTLVVLYQRAPCHWGKDKGKSDKHSGIRMVVTSSDGGKTWSQPVDIIDQAGAKWEHTPFWGFGGGIGTYQGNVYVALNGGVYVSKDKGKNWKLVADQPSFASIPHTIWSPGGRITFDDEHGLIIWSTRGFSQDAKERYKGLYGTHLAAIYSPDFGKSWEYEEQELLDGLRASEVTSLRYEGKIAFFLRNGFKNVRYGQGYSETGWFPFRFALSNVRTKGIVDTPDINYNPVTRRLEIAVPYRAGDGPGPAGGMKVNLYSISREAFAHGETNWQFDGTLIRHRQRFGLSDGFGVTGSVIDTKHNMRIFHVWAGDCTGMAGIFQYSVSLDTPTVSAYLQQFYDQTEPKK